MFAPVSPASSRVFRDVTLDVRERRAGCLEDLHGLPAHKAMLDAVHLGEGSLTEETLDFVRFPDNLSRRKDRHGQIPSTIATSTLPRPCLIPIAIPGGGSTADGPA